MIDEIPGDLLQWLRGFYFVAQSGSITHATARMGREQPTITRQIKCLEKELDVTLFDRSSGTMKLTTEGRILFEKAVTLFEDVKEIRDEFREKQLEHRGRIALATSHAIVESFLPRHIIKFRNTHPRVTFHIEGGIFATVLEKVESSEVDFGIAFTDSVPSSMHSYDLFETGLKLIAPKNSSFFPDGFPTLNQIARIPLMFFSQAGGSIDPFMERWFMSEGLRPNLIMTHNNFTSAKKYVSLGLGAALLSGYALSEEDEERFDIFALDRYFPKRKIGIIVRKRKYLSPAVEAFIRVIKPDIQLLK